jgi:hypothetical protein
MPCVPIGDKSRWMNHLNKIGQTYVNDVQEHMWALCKDEKLYMYDVEYSIGDGMWMDIWRCNHVF